MLPQSLRNTYLHYKEDTDSVAAWLASTAKKHGFPAEKLAERSWQPLPQKSGRVKGNARKEAREKGRINNVPEGRKYIVAIRDFVPLAEFLAEEAITVPQNFMKTLDRVIDTRSRFPRLMREHEVEVDEASLQRHEHLVAILETVRERLKGQLEVSNSEDIGGTTKPGDTGAPEIFSNRFSLLTFHETSSDFVAPAATPKPQESSIIYQAETQVSEIEALLAYLMLLEDLWSLRQVIQHLWEMQANGKLDLAAAAIATNTAIEFARGIIQDIEPLLKAQEHGAFGVAEKAFRLCRCGTDLAGVPLKDANARQAEYYTAGDNIILNAAAFVHKFQHLCLPDLHFSMEKQYLQKHNLMANWDALSGQQRMDMDFHLVAGFLTELMTIIQSARKFHSEDELLRGLQRFDETGEPPFSLVFACQVFLDIHHVMRSKVQQPCEILHQQVGYMVKNLEIQLKFAKSAKSEKWSQANEAAVRRTLELLAEIQNNHLQDEKTSVANSATTFKTTPAQVRLIYQYSPVLTGLVLFRCRMESYHCGIDAMNAYGSVVCSAHLHHALACERLLENRWQDLEIALRALGESNFWVGNRPRGTENYGKWLDVQLGVSIASLIDPSKKRRNVSDRSRAGPRQIQEGVIVSSAFFGRFEKGDGRMECSPRFIDDILAQSDVLIEPDEEGSERIVKITDAAGRRIRSRAQEDKRKARATGRTIPGADGVCLTTTITDLADALNFEVIELAYPYTILQLRSWLLLKGVKEACGPIFKELGVPVPNKDHQLPLVVQSIFRIANGIDNHGVQDFRPLMAAAEVLNRFVRKTGNGSMAGNMIIDEAAEKMGFRLKHFEDGTIEIVWQAWEKPLTADPTNTS